MVEADENTIAIIDNGSGMMKAGIAGDDAPSVVFPSIVGEPKQASAMQGVTQKSQYIGDEAQQKRGVLNLSYPIANGIVTDWAKMEQVWHHTFYNELRITPSEIQGVLITEAPRNPKENREKMMTYMFETFEVKNSYVAIQAVMSLYANGRSTGLVVDSGDGVTHTVPVFEGFSIPHAIEKMEIAGRVITDYAQKLLLEAGHSFTSSAELETVKDIKEKLCYIAADYDAELAAANASSAQDQTYTLPDKSVIPIKGSIRLQTAELLFKPELNGKSCLSIHGLAWKSISSSDVDVRRDLSKNVILSGGSTMYEGLADRLKAEIEAQAPAGAEIRIIATQDRKYAVWKGASTLASLSSFAASWISKEEYDEHGAGIVHRKCQ
jgi:actin-related protein